mmetsp:Transcript_1053/g.1767  ORF Transcript_1053/g.1767 Transcript_1053/m.1767 type:complete len:303 (-) Transcript_1053:50-958(-)
MEGLPEWLITPRVMDLRNTLEKLLEEVRMPDMEFLFNLGDGIDQMLPAEIKPGVSTGVPIFSPDKNHVDFKVMLAPPRSFSFHKKWYLWGEFQPYNIPFHTKIRKAVFRGSTTGGIYHDNDWFTYPRSKVVNLSLQRPDLVDARFTGCVQCEGNVSARMEELGFINELSILNMQQQAEYQMILVVDGNSVPDRYPQQLAWGSAILRQESRRAEFWYEDMKPWVHYIPFKNDVSDLESILAEAQKNVSRLEAIAKAGKNHVLRRLNHETVACYWVQLLERYSQLFQGPVLNISRVPFPDPRKR